MRQEVTHEEVLASLAAREQRAALEAPENRHYVGLLTMNAVEQQVPLTSPYWSYWHEEWMLDPGRNYWRTRNWDHTRAEPVTSRAYRVHRAASLLSRERRRRMRDEVRQAVMALDAGETQPLMRDEMLTDALVTLRRALANERLL